MDTTKIKIFTDKDIENLNTKTHNFLHSHDIHLIDFKFMIENKTKGIALLYMELKK